MTRLVSNDIIKKTLTNLVDLTKRYRRRSLMNQLEQNHDSFKSEIKRYIDRHCILIETLLTGDVKLAKKAITEHIKNRTFYTQIANTPS